MPVGVVAQVVVSGILMGTIYALIAIGFTMVFGVMNIVNFAHGHFVMLGMFAAYSMFSIWHVDPYLSLLLVLPAFFLLGILFYKLLIDRLVGGHHFTQIVCTIGLFIFLENLVNSIYGGDLRGVTTGYTTSAVVIAGTSIPVARAFAAALSIAAVTLLNLFLRKTRFGSAIRAAANNEIGAHLVGVDVRQIYMHAFAISVVLAALAGAVLLPFSLVSPFVSHDFMFKAFVIAIIGGLGSVPGALLGGLLIGVSEALAGLFLTDSFGNVLVFSLLILVLIFRPAGLLGGRAA